MRIALLVLLLTSTALADTRLGGNIGGGMEGGLFSGALRPDGVMEVGVEMQHTPPGKSWGLGVSFERIGRLTPPGTSGEGKLDVAFVATRNDVWMSAGLGLRSLHYGRDGFDDRVMGVDLFHLAASKAFWKLQTSGKSYASIDLYLAWTFGCYIGSVRRPPVGDMAAPERDIACKESITTTYTVGVATSMTWR